MYKRQHTDAKGSGFWPTPQARESGKKLGNYDHKRNRYLTKDGHDYGMGLAQAVQMWPTPRASEWKGVGPLGSKSHQYRLDKSYLDATVQEAEGRTGKLNPTWVEWLMGWPLGWTDLKPLETDKFQQWLQQHGCC